MVTVVLKNRDVRLLLSAYPNDMSDFLHLQRFGPHTVKQLAWGQGGYICFRKILTFDSPAYEDFINKYRLARSLKENQ